MNPLIDVSTAERSIASSVRGFVSEHVPIEQAPGRILRQTVQAERDQPPFDRVMMDGIAVRWSETLPPTFAIAGARMAGPLTDADLAGEGLAGAALAGARLAAALPMDASACIEITTGAMLPDVFDCVIPIEQTRRVDGGYALAPGYVPSAWQFVHRRASDCSAGATVLAAGVRIGAPEIAVLAANGVASVEVAKAPAVAIVATGDELATVDAELKPGQIRRSNDLALLATLRPHGFDRVSLHHVVDDERRLRETLATLLGSHAVLVLSGGVSMGQRDFVPSCLEGLGVRCIFHGIAQRPGKPMWFGVGPQGQAVFALPGNPVSSLVCMIRYVRPALLSAMGLRSGAPEQARLGAGADGLPSRLTCFVPVEVRPGRDGSTLAIPVSSRNSGDFTSLAGTQGIVEIPAGENPGPGTPLSLYRW